MKNILLVFSLLLILPFYSATDKDNLTVYNIDYNDIDYYSVTITWKTNIPATSKVRYMKSDSNYQAINYTDSTFNNSYDTIHSITLSLLDPHTLYNFSVTSVSQAGTVVISQNSMFATKAATEGTINIYFNKSIDTTVSNGVNAQGNTDLVYPILQKLNHSRYYLDIALNKFEDCDELVNEILKAKRNGAVIRFIYAGSQPSPWVDTLKAHGVKVIKRKNDGHNLNMNFWIFDARCTCSGGEVYVYTTTGQITNQDRFVNKNCGIMMKDRTVAYIYTREFDEMWGSFTDYPDTAIAKFGNQKRDNIPHKVNMNGVYAEFYFSPSDSVNSKIEKFINKASSKLFFVSNNFSSQSLYNKFYDLRTRLNIKGIFDYQNSASGVYSQMNSWCNVIRDTTQGRLFNNYILTDPQYNSQSSYALSGSYKWNDESNLYNDEDLIIFYNSQIANQFYQEYHQRYRDITGSVLSSNQISNTIPSDYKLHQNYPNPFNPVTKINFDLPKSSFVNIKVFDITGKEIRTIINEYKSAGSYTVTFDAARLPSGIYFYRMESDGFISTKRMILIK